MNRRMLHIKRIMLLLLVCIMSLIAQRYLSTTAFLYFIIIVGAALIMMKVKYLARLTIISNSLEKSPFQKFLNIVMSSSAIGVFIALIFWKFRISQFAVLLWNISLLTIISVSIIRIIATIKLPSMSKTKTGIVLIVILYLNMIVLASGLLIRFSLKR
jgi:hypothetical protein